MLSTLLAELQLAISETLSHPTSVAWSMQPWRSFQSGYHSNRGKAALRFRVNWSWTVENPPRAARASGLQKATCTLTQLPLQLQPRTCATSSPGFSFPPFHITAYRTNNWHFGITEKWRKRSSGFPKGQHSLQGTAELCCLKKEWFKTQYFPLMFTDLDVTLIRALWMVDTQPYALLLKSREINDI